MKPGVEYWAGFFDGEGCVGVQTSPAGFTYIHLSVTQMDKKPLELLKAAYGGYITVNKRHGNGRARTWKWGSNSSQAIRCFLADIGPFLIVKAEEVAVAQRLVDLVYSKGEQNKLLRAQLGAQLREFRAKRIERNTE